jgi:hypothetical protein
MAQTLSELTKLICSPKRVCGTRSDERIRSVFACECGVDQYAIGVNTLYITCIWLCLAICGCDSTRPSRLTQRADEAISVIGETSVLYKSEGYQHVSHSFTLRNNLPDPVSLSIEKSCSCTDASISNSIVGPHGVAVVEMTLDTSQRLATTVLVKGSDRDDVRIVLELKATHAFVHPRTLWMTPTVQYCNGITGDPAQFDFILWCRTSSESSLPRVTSRDFAIYVGSNLSSMIDSMKDEVDQTGSAGTTSLQKFRVRVRTPAWQEHGRIRYSVKVELVTVGQELTANATVVANVRPSE